MRDRSFKIILLGDPGVGKTSIRKRYMGQGFKTTYLMTIGADFAVKKIPHKNGNIILQIWDLSGQIGFKAVRRMYFDHTSAIMIVYDVSNSASLFNIGGWLSEYKSNGAPYPLPITIVANKSDLVQPDELETNFNDQIKMLHNIDAAPMSFYHASALSGENIDAMFDELVHKLV